MSTPLSGDGLFDLPSDIRREPLARVVLLSGASGSGKTRFAKRTRLPAVGLDNFYYDVDQPGMPLTHGEVDWDHIETWNRRGAVLSLVELCTTGSTSVPVYDIPTSRKIGAQDVSLNGERIVVAEGIFAADIITDLTSEGILAEALAITRPRLTAAWFRLMRDLDEGRKKPSVLVRRGWEHFLRHPGTYRDLEDKGARPVTVDEAGEIVATLRRRP